jgi:hypothetical protein
MEKRIKFIKKHLINFKKPGLSFRSQNKEYKEKKSIVAIGKLGNRTFQISNEKEKQQESIIKK